MELCTTEFTKLKKLCPESKNEMMKKTAVNSYYRKKEIQEIITNTNLSTILKNFNIKLDTNMETTVGQIIEQPCLVYGKDETKKLGDWILINGGRTLNNAKTMENFIEAFKDGIWNHGVQIKDPLEVIPISYPDERKSREVLDYAYKRYKNLKFIMAIVPGTSIFYSLLIFFDHTIF